LDYYPDAGAGWTGDTEVEINGKRIRGMQVGEAITTNKLTVVVGIGATGLSVARFLSQRGEKFIMVDTRVDPPGLDELSKTFPDIPVELGDLNSSTLHRASTVVVSPGLAIDNPELLTAVKGGVDLTGDIQLFADCAVAPIVAITGSNGKSTVTTLVGMMAEEAGLNVGVGGNLGIPALDLLDENRELYVVELSSFQLELVESLRAEVACVLNVSPDHMDRYKDIHEYHRAKHRAFRGAEQVVVNRQDLLTQPLVPTTVKQWTFGLDAPDFNGFGVALHEGDSWLFFEREPLIPVSEVAIQGNHNIANALAALALGHAVNIPMPAMLTVLKRFKGLPHRCENIASIEGVIWINDSKATNVGASVAAIEGLAGDRPDIILLAGGQGKDQTFDELGIVADGKVKKAILLGEDASLLAEKLSPVTPVLYATNLDSAVHAAAEAAVPGDKVILSPACASFDMFNNYQHRGEMFIAAVRRLL